MRQGLFLTLMNSVRSGRSARQRGKYHTHKKRNTRCVEGKGRRKVNFAWEWGSTDRRDNRAINLRLRRHSQGRNKSARNLRRRKIASAKVESRMGVMKKVSIMKAKCLERPPGAKLGWLILSTVWCSTQEYESYYWVIWDKLLLFDCLRYKMEVYSEKEGMQLLLRARRGVSRDDWVRLETGPRWPGRSASLDTALYANQAAGCRLTMVVCV